MEDHTQKIKGYRDLNREEINLMNHVKDLGEQISEVIKNLESDTDTDKRSIALAKTNMQQGLMWAIRSIAKPDSF